MSGRAIRGEHKPRRWVPERDLKRARDNKHDLEEMIMDTKKEIDELRKRNETLKENNKKLKGIIRRQEGEGASREVIESAALRLKNCQKYSADQGLKLNRLKDKRYELEAIKREWESWRRDIEEECNRRAVLEAQIRNKEPRSYESWKKSSNHSAR